MSDVEGRTAAIQRAIIHVTRLIIDHRRVVDRLRERVRYQIRISLRVSTLHAYEAAVVVRLADRLRETDSVAEQRKRPPGKQRCRLRRIGISYGLIQVDAFR